MFCIALTINANPTPWPLALSSMPTQQIMPVLSLDGQSGRNVKFSQSSVDGEAIIVQPTCCPDALKATITSW